MKLDSQLIASIIMVIATVILVIITGFYAWVNSRILKEMHKDRKIRSLERRLENLYSPLKSQIEFIDQIDALLEDNKPPKSLVGWDDFEKVIESLRKNIHLSSKELELDLRKFLDSFIGQLGTEGDNIRGFLGERKEQFIKQIEYDFKKYQNELIKLEEENP